MAIQIKNTEPDKMKCEGRRWECQKSAVKGVWGAQTGCSPSPFFLGSAPAELGGVGSGTTVMVLMVSHDVLDRCSVVGLDSWYCRCIGW